MAMTQIFELFSSYAAFLTRTSYGALKFKSIQLGDECKTFPGSEFLFQFPVVVF
jgi:hypothetical protein